MKNGIKNLHLSISAIVILLVALIYGANPSQFIPTVFGFSVTSVELANIFRATMGLYLGFAIYWVLGALKPEYWKAATMSNIIFMGGLAFGRILSTFLDGISMQFTMGVFAELVFMLWGIYNIRNYNPKDLNL